jgi:DNA-directed RNA polymerase sigma subunit (sigma70/sigma32)
MANIKQQQTQGNDMNEPMTLKEIAQHEGISHQAIAEILERALRKFNKALEAKGIKLEDLL